MNRDARTHFFRSITDASRELNAVRPLANDLFVWGESFARLRDPSPAGGYMGEETEVREEDRGTSFSPAVVSVKLPISLLNQLEKIRVALGYPTRSELIRDALREFVLSRHSLIGCLLYTSPSPRDLSTSRMPSSA